MILRIPSTAPRDSRDHASRGPLGDACYVMSTNERRHYYEGPGPLSIKSFFNGGVLYDVGAGRCAVDDGCYLVLNDRQRYAITLDADDPVESFCLFFAPGFAERAFASLTSPDGRLLDDPDCATGPVYFFERSYRHDDVLSPALFALRAALPRRRDDPMWIEEQLHTIVARLLEAHRKAAREATAIPAARAATREELYRRLHRARDYAAACYDEPLSVDGMARVACLSPTHFLRSFRALFGETPHQFLTGRRLERARELLERTPLPVTDICFAVGYESLGSFSSLFRRRFGVSPDGYRREKGRFREAVPPPALP